MEIKYKFGNFKIKIFYEGESGKTYNKNNPLESQFPIPNLELFSRMYEKVPTNLMNYYRDVNKAFEEYINSLKKTGDKKVNDKNIPDYPYAMPASGHDIYNYVARYDLANFQIQAVIKLDGCLDFKKLSRAVRLSIDEQPVFGCRFVENEPPYWKSLNNIDETVFCTKEETENPDEAVRRFLESPLDMDNDPMVKVKLIRSDVYDTICLKINHACSDGTGAKEFIELLSGIYSCIDQDYGIFIPEPNKRGRKDQDRLFSELGIANPEAEWIPGSETTRATWSFPWKNIKTDASRFVVCKLPEGQLKELTSYSKARGATINDLILTAYYRAMSEMGQPDYSELMEIPVTVDLRRYLPDHRTEAIRNFSGSEFTRLALMPNESFDETLSRVIPMMNEIKNARAGLQSAIGLERVEKMSLSETLAYYKSVAEWPYHCGDKCAPVLSNLGIISKSLLKFGQRVATDAYIVPPVVAVPGLLMMVSTYNSIVTLIAGYFETTVQREDIERLVNKIKDELIEICTSDD